MCFPVEVRGRMLVRRVVAAPDVPTLGAPAEVYPDTAHEQAFHAPVAARSNGTNLFEMSTGVGHDCSLAKVSSAGAAAPRGHEGEERECAEGRVRDDLAD